MGLSGTTGDDARYRLRELDAADIAAVQQFFEASPEYFWIVNGEGPRPDEARTEFADLPPAGMAYRKMSLLGFYDGAGTLIGFATMNKPTCQTCSARRSATIVAKPISVPASS